jgi:cell division protein FtsN
MGRTHGGDLPWQVGWYGRGATVARGVLGSLIGGWTLVSSPIALAQRLPPPPPRQVPSGLTPPRYPLQNPTSTDPALPLPRVSPNAVYRPPTPDRPIPRDRILVIISGDSPLLLQQVRRVVPTAFVAQYQGRRVIQAGTFATLANAQRHIATLQAHGLAASVLTAAPLPDAPASFQGETPLPPQPTGTVRSPSTPPRPNATTRPNPAHYHVIIPADQQSLGNLADQAIRLGVRPTAIQQRQAPLGPHLDIGPFTERRDAETVNTYLRQKGMDARVTFQP